MAFEFDLNKIKEDLISAGKDVEEFAKDTSAVAKLKYDIHSKENFLEKQYALLGKEYYQAQKEHMANTEAVGAGFFSSIEEAEEELCKMKEKLLILQGSVVCPACGVIQTKKNSFCCKCGAKL